MADGQAIAWSPHQHGLSLGFRGLFEGWKILREGRQTLEVSGQIIATSHDLTPNGGLVREIPLFQGKLGR